MFIERRSREFDLIIPVWMDEALGYDMIVRTVEVPPALSVELKGVATRCLLVSRVNIMCMSSERGAELSRRDEIPRVWTSSARIRTQADQRAFRSRRGRVCSVAGYFLKRESTITPTVSFMSLSTSARTPSSIRNSPLSPVKSSPTTFVPIIRSGLRAAKKDGTARKDSSMRKFRDPAEHYLGSWDLLGLD